MTADKPILIERERSICVECGGQLVVSLPRRLWEPTGTTSRGVTVWQSRTRTRKEWSAIRKRLRCCLDGPVEDLEHRLMAGLATDRNDSNRLDDFKRPARWMPVPEPLPPPKRGRGRPKK